MHPDHLISCISGLVLEDRLACQIDTRTSHLQSLQVTALGAWREGMCEMTKAVRTSKKQHCIRTNARNSQKQDSKETAVDQRPSKYHPRHSHVCPDSVSCPKFSASTTQWHPPLCTPRLTTLTGLAPQHAMPPCRPPQPSGVRPAQHSRWQPPWHSSSPHPSCCAVQARLRGKLKWELERSG